MVERWKHAWQLPAFRRQFWITFPVLVAVLFTFSKFLEWVERREGIVLQDPILPLLHPYDFTWIIFAFVYGGIVLGLAVLSTRPVRLVIALQGYCLLVLVRMVAMFRGPLNAPPGIIPLIDPIVQYFGSGAVLTKDLFFSGHTAILVLLSLASGDRFYKAIFTISATIVAVLITWQHVHYTIDVLSAPFFALGSFHLIVLQQQRSGLTRG